MQPGKGVEFDSSCSTGVVENLLWDVRRKDAPNIVLGQSTDPVYIHVLSDPGEYVVTLSLKDRFGSEDRTSVTVTVTSSAISPDEQ